MAAHVTFFLFFFILLTQGCSHDKSINDSKVFIKEDNGGYTLFKDQLPIKIKGAAGSGYFSLLKKLGGNTIRVYDTLNLQAALDSAKLNELVVMVDLPIAGSKYYDSFYQDEGKVKAQYLACNNTIKKYKDHPALLMWCLGNEIVFPTGLKFNRFYSAYNELLDMVHRTDPDHPVTTTLKNLNSRSVFNIKMRVHGIDLISINTFGQIASLKEDLDRIALIWNGPYLISEWGVNGYWEESFTAWDVPVEPSGFFKNIRIREVESEFMPHQDPRFLGSIFFYWGNKQERTNTWFSLFDEAGNRATLTETLSEIWLGNQKGGQKAEIKEMLLNRMSAYDNIMLEPGKLAYGEFNMDIKTDPGTVIWQIKPEDWYSEQMKDQNLSEIENLIISQNEQKVCFKAPVKTGPYRLFAKTIDSSGVFSQANIPFYVIR